MLIGKKMKVKSIVLLPEITGQWGKVASQGKAKSKTYEYEIPLFQNLIK